MRKTGQILFAVFWLPVFLLLWCMPGGVRHPAKSTVIERKPGECKCPGNFMCVECQKMPKDRICRCEPTKEDYARAEAAYQSLLKDFAPILNITPDP